MRCKVRGFSIRSGITKISGSTHLGKWQIDEDKLTFIILSRQPLDGTLDLPAKILPTHESLSSLPMVGDVNIFLHGQIPSPQDTLQTTTSDSDNENEFHAEVEIMIAGATIEITSLGKTKNKNNNDLPKNQNHHSDAKDWPLRLSS